jgi:anti-anti-sigma factor
LPNKRLKMVNQKALEAILDSDVAIRKHFVLKVLEPSNSGFVYMALRADSSGKDLESIIVIYGKLCSKLETVEQLNLVFSFKEITYFGDLGLAVTVRLAQNIVDQGGLFVVIEPQKQVLDIMVVLGLTDIIPVYSTEEEFRAKNIQK